MAIPHFSPGADGIFAAYLPTPAASWIKVAKSGGDVDLVRFDDGALADAFLTQAAEVLVINNGTDTVYFTCNEAQAAGAPGTNAPRIPGGGIRKIPLMGTGTPPVVWIYGSGTSDVEVWINTSRAQGSV